MVVDVEVTLNRFGFGLVAPNKLQVAFLRFSYWADVPKHSISFEVNWKPREQCPSTDSHGIRCEKKEHHWGRHACPAALTRFLRAGRRKVMLDAQDYVSKDWRA